MSKLLDIEPVHIVCTNGIAKEYTDSEMYDVFIAYIKNYVLQHIRNNYKHLFDESGEEIEEWEKLDIADSVAEKIDEGISEDIDGEFMLRHITAQ